MQKIYKQLLAGLLSLALFLTACGGSYEFDLGSDYSYGDDTIASLNSYVDLGNAGYDATYLLSDDVYYYETDLENYEALAATGIGLDFTCSFYIYDKEYIYDQVMNPSSNLTAEEQSMLTGKAQAMMTSLDKMESDCLALELYVASEEYLTDDFAKSTELLNAMYDEYDLYLDAHNDMLDYVDGLFDIYETFEVDTSDPESVALGNMRATIDLAEEGLDIIEDMYLNIDFSQAQAASDVYNELDALISSHMMHSYELEDYYVAMYYDYYYSDLNDYYMPELKNGIVAANNADIDSLDWSYSFLLDYYNFLIDDYNYFLDEVSY